MERKINKIVIKYCKGGIKNGDEKKKKEREKIFVILDECILVSNVFGLGYFV